MAVKISLQDLVDEMQMQSDGCQIFLNKHTGKFILITDDDLWAAERGEDEEIPDWQVDTIAELKRMQTTEDYLKIPDQFEIHEYKIMERFCLSVPDEDISNELLDKIRGRGAFRNFKDAVYDFGIEKDWFKYRDKAYREIAVDWLEFNELAYIDDMNDAPGK